MSKLMNRFKNIDPKKTIDLIQSIQNANLKLATVLQRIFTGDSIFDSISILKEFNKTQKDVWTDLSYGELDFSIKFSDVKDEDVILLDITYPATNEVETIKLTTELIIAVSSLMARVGV